MTVEPFQISDDDSVLAQAATAFQSALIRAEGSTDSMRHFEVTAARRRLLRLAYGRMCARPVPMPIRAIEPVPEEEDEGE
jgi:hypothetical protein